MARRKKGYRVKSWVFTCRGTVNLEVTDATICRTGGVLGRDSLAYVCHTEITCCFQFRFFFVGVVKVFIQYLKKANKRE